MKPVRGLMLTRERGDYPDDAANYLLQHLGRDRALVYVQRCLTHPSMRGRGYWEQVEGYIRHARVQRVPDDEAKR